MKNSECSPAVASSDDAAASRQRGSGDRPWGLEIQNVTKRFGRASALDGITLGVEHGEFFTILGPSGSGKTTLLRIIAGFTPLTSGRVILEGRDVSRVAPKDRAIGMVFQHYALFPHMTVAKNIDYPLRLRGWGRKDRATRTEEMLELVGLHDKGERLPRELSGGQQQRVAVARALAFRPALLLMDEPLGALDRELRVRMSDELRRLHRELGATVVYVTHDREEALTLSDRIAILRDGAVEVVDSAQALYERPATEFVARFFGFHNVIGATVERQAADVAHVAVGDTGSGARIAVRVAERCKVGPASLAIPADAIGLEAQCETAWRIGGRIDEVVYMGETLKVVVTGTPGGSLVAHIRSEFADQVVMGRNVPLYIDTRRVVVVQR